MWGLIALICLVCIINFNKRSIGFYTTFLLLFIPYFFEWVGFVVWVLNPIIHLASVWILKANNKPILDKPMADQFECDPIPPAALIDEFKYLDTPTVTRLKKANNDD
jgi:hypothetical protein